LTSLLTVLEQFWSSFLVASCRVASCPAVPARVEQLKQRLGEYRKTAVLSWLNFEDRNPAADSSNFGPIGTL
jgi:hypothetical protein